MIVNKMPYEFAAVGNNNKLDKLGKKLDEFHHQFYFDKINAAYKMHSHMSALQPPSSCF